MSSTPLGAPPLMALVPEALRKLRARRRPTTAPEGRVQLDDFVAMVRDVVVHHDGEALCVAGALPAGLDARYVAGGWYAPTQPPIAHLLDAYTTMVGWTIRDGRAYVRVRPIDDPNRDAEVAAGRILRKGLGTPPGGSLLSRASTAIGRPSVHECVVFGDAVLAVSTPRALWIDLATLEGRGDAFTGAYDARDPGVTHGNHPQVDPATGRLVTALFRSTPVFSTEVSFLELDPDGRCHERRTYAPGFLPHHAFGFTASSYVVPDNPLRPPGWRYLLGRARGVLEAMPEDMSRPLQLHLVPREGDGPAVLVPLPDRGFIYHVLGCYDEGGSTHVDAFLSNLDPLRESSQFELDPRFPVSTHRGAVLRFTIDRARGTATSRLLVPGVQRVTFDAIDERLRGQPYRRAWFVANDQHEGGRSEVIAADVVTGTCERWSTGERLFLRQLRYVPAPGSAPEGPGWLLVPAYAPSGTRLLVFDAHRVADGPVAELSAGVRLPYTNHGCVS